MFVVLHNSQAWVLVTTFSASRPELIRRLDTILKPHLQERKRFTNTGQSSSYQSAIPTFIYPLPLLLGPFTSSSADILSVAGLRDGTTTNSNASVGLPTASISTNCKLLSLFNHMRSRNRWILHPIYHAHLPPLLLSGSKRLRMPLLQPAHNPIITSSLPSDHRLLPSSGTYSIILISISIQLQIYTRSAHFLRCDSRQTHPSPVNHQPTTHNHRPTTTTLDRPRSIQSGQGWNYPAFYLPAKPQKTTSSPTTLQPLPIGRIRPAIHWQWISVQETREWLHHPWPMDNLSPTLLLPTVRLYRRSGVLPPRASHSNSFSPNRPNTVRDCP